MPTLPAHPNLEQLRHQAKDLLRAATTGDGDALAQIQAVSAQLTLSAAQLVVARGYGFASWTKLKAEVEARTLDLAEKVDAFCTASIRDGSGRATSMLAATPEIAAYSFATAVILGDPARVSEELRRDPGLATARDPRSGWTPLHAVCASRWNQFEPERASGLLTVAASCSRLELRRPLRCAATGRRCAARSPAQTAARATEPSSNCCSTRAPSRTTTTSISPASRTTAINCCRPCSHMCPIWRRSRNRRSPHRSATPTPKACGSCSRPVLIRVDTTTTTASQPPS